MMQTAGPVPVVVVVMVGIGLTLALFGPPVPSAGAPEPLVTTNVTAQSLQRYCASQLSAANDALAAAHKLPVNVLHHANEIDRLLANVGNLGYLLMNVHPDERVRTAGSACFQVAGDNTTALSLNTNFYKLFVELDKARPPMTPVTARFLDRKLNDFKRAGVDKGPDERQRLLDLSNSMLSLGQVFERNMNNDVRHVRVPTSDSAKLEMLPADFIASHTDSATNEVVISTDYPDYFPVMKYARNRALRLELFKKFTTRGMPANEPILLQLLQKRHEYANAVGFPDWASYAQADKMVQRPKVVREFLATVRRLTTDRTEAELAELLRYLQSDESADVHAVQAYDAAFYINRVRDDKFHLNSKTIRNYFTYGATREGIMGLASTMFRVKFKGRPDVKAWHDDVNVFDVLSHPNDKEARVIGRVYLDMFPREGKYKHAANFPVREGIVGRQLPEAALVCNFPKAGPMEHADVVTFLHEFGHLMHHIVGGQDKHWEAFSGIATEWDFVEAPSQMLEEWAWDHATLAKFARDPSSGNAIPKPLVTKMRTANEFGKGINTQQQMFYATLSLELHSNFERLRADSEPSGAGIITLLKDIQARTSPYPYVPDTHFDANFGHLVGYSSNYYTYAWSLVLAKDMFSRFAAEGMHSQKVADAYTRSVLYPGGTRNASVLVKSFLGRPFKFTAFEQWLEAESPPPMPGHESGTAANGGSGAAVGSAAGSSRRRLRQ